MDIINITEQIQSKIGEIGMVRSVIKDRAEKKAQTIAEYEKSIAIQIIQIKNGKEIDIDGNIISGNKLQANLVEKVARGICWQEKLEMEKADAMYKSAITNMQALMAELNGLQSMLRYLDEN